MRTLLKVGAIAAVLLAASPVSAQFVPPSQPMAQVEASKMTSEYWAPKRGVTPYKAPNRVHWKLAEILAAHRGDGDWVQPLVRNSEQEADYIALAEGHKTEAKMYADDRVVFIVQDGQLRVSIDGAEPFVATKGFMVTVPFRHPYTLEALGDKPALRFEVRHAGAVPLYPLSSKPKDLPGYNYVRVTGTPGPSKLNSLNNNPLYVDFWKDVAVGDHTNSAKFVWDDNFTSNILRGKAAPVPPVTNKGHFHADWTEFWFIMEGKIGYQIEGFPYFEADQGDIVIADTGRWHRAGNSPNAPMSTRIPFNPRPVILHNFEPVIEAPH